MKRNENKEDREKHRRARLQRMMNNEIEIIIKECMQEETMKVKENTELCNRNNNKECMEEDNRNNNKVRKIKK